MILRVFCVSDVDGGAEETSVQPAVAAGMQVLARLKEGCGR